MTTLFTAILAAIRYPQWIDSEIVRIGPVAIRWYGLAYVVGFIIAYVVLDRMARRGLFRVKRELVGDLIFWLAIGVFAGGRLGWWAFYHRYDPAGPPEAWYEPIAAWRGGMSFHGGLIGVILVMILWGRWRKVPILNIADCGVLVAPIGLFLGRLANFVNAELVGRPTSVPWGVIFPGDDFARHPSQLYEAFLEGPLLLGLLWLALWLWRPRDGRIGGLFLILYGLFRFSVEFTREPDPQLGFIAFGWLTMGQLLSAFLVLAGAVFMALLPRKAPEPEAPPPKNGPARP